MEKYVDLLKQINSVPFKNVTFSIFNYIDNEGFVDEVCGANKEKYGIDDFEYLKLLISEKEKNGIKFSNKEIVSNFKNFKSYIENDLQEDSIPKMRVFLIKESGSLIVVRLKNFNIKINASEE